MARPKSVPEDTTQVKVWIDPELLEWIDQFAEEHQRSRAYVINQGMRRWRNRVEDSRKRRVKAA